MSHQILFLGAHIKLLLGNVRYRCNVYNLNLLHPEFLINIPMALFFPFVFHHYLVTKVRNVSFLCCHAVLRGLYFFTVGEEMEITKQLLSSIFLSLSTCVCTHTYRSRNTILRKKFGIQYCKKSAINTNIKCHILFQIPLIQIS